MGRLRSTRTYPYALSRVYDLRQYTTLNEWGPFMDDSTGRVDWEKMEAILVVMGYNLGLTRDQALQRRLGQPLFRVLAEQLHAVSDDRALPARSERPLWRERHLVSGW